jgi:large subunit ribosomal protein L25
MKEFVLPAHRRDTRGKNLARGLRRDGSIPGIVYGPETDPQSVSVAEKDFRQAMRAIASGSSVLDLDVEGKRSKVIIRELQRDPVTSHVLHVDFHAISMNKPINVMIPVHFMGTPKGVKTDGGIMQTTMREIEISCLPADIPPFVELDVSELGIGEAIHVEDLDLGNVEVLTDKLRTIVVISAPTVVKAALEEAEGEEAEGAEAAEGEGEEAEGEEKAEGEKAPEGKQGGEARKEKKE